MNYATIKTSGWPLAMLACWLFTGCGDRQHEKLVGTWNLETGDSVLSRLGNQADAVTGDSPTAEASDLNSDPSAARMQLRFDRDGTLTTTTRMGMVTPTPKQGRWVMTAYDSALEVMKINCVIGLQKTEHDVKFSDPDTISLTPPNMAGLKMELEFKRQ